MSSDLSISQPHPNDTDGIQKVGLALVAIGLLILLIAQAGIPIGHKTLWLASSIISVITGTVVYALRKYLTRPKGISNNGVWQNSLTNRGIWAWMLGILLTGFYIVLYWFPALLGAGEGANTGLVALFDPLSHFLNGGKADEYFLYGTVYSVAVLSLGFKFMLKYRHNRYQLRRTIVVTLIQLSLAYIIPELLRSLQRPDATFEMDVKNFWPLKYDFFDGDNLDAMRKNGALGMFFLITGIAGFTILAPVITYFAGKRWYCSWVCGCGGLAETAGDPFRNLSSKKIVSWRIERWLIHSILLLTVTMTALVLYTYFTGQTEAISGPLREFYGFMIGSVFSGIIGVGFYPIMGNRVWCRFGCPMAAYIGLVQRFKSRFRITTNGGQCISCGNCSTFCEQGIDVRAYAQRGQNIVRASCVGCGICATVCPRGVLKLENGPEDGRINEKSLLLGLLNDEKQ
jgi:Pyruvate/2-oxoacid:ferredoxin oxidoreductase delta subunit